MLSNYGNGKVVHFVNVRSQANKVGELLMLENVVLFIQRNV